MSAVQALQELLRLSGHRQAPAFDNPICRVFFPSPDGQAAPVGNIMSLAINVLKEPLYNRKRYGEKCGGG